MYVKSVLSYSSFLKVTYICRGGGSSPLIRLPHILRRGTPRIRTPPLLYYVRTYVRRPCVTICTICDHFLFLGACHPIICAAIPSEGRSRSRKSQAKAAEPFPPTAGPKPLPAPACTAPPRSSPCPAGHMMLGGWPTKPTPSEVWPTPEQMTA